MEKTVYVLKQTTIEKTKKQVQYGLFRLDDEGAIDMFYSTMEHLSAKELANQLCRKRDKLFENNGINRLCISYRKPDSFPEILIEKWGVRQYQELTPDEQVEFTTHVVDALGGD